MNTNTTVMLNELYRIFNALNERYFDNSLPEVFIVLQKGKSKTRNVYGTFTPESWVHNDGEEEDELGNGWNTHLDKIWQKDGIQLPHI